MTLALLQALPEAGVLAADGTAIAVLVGVFVVLLALGVRVAFAIGLATVATMMLSIPDSDPCHCVFHAICCHGSNCFSLVG